MFKTYADPPTSLIFLNTAFVVFPSAYPDPSRVHYTYLGIIAQIRVDGIELVFYLLFGLDDRLLLFAQGSEQLFSSDHQLCPILASEVRQTV
jgi:hypothetical protein